LYRGNHGAGPFFFAKDTKLAQNEARPGLEGRRSRCRRQWSGQGPAEPRKALCKIKRRNI